MHRSISLTCKLAVAAALVLSAPIASAGGQPNVSWSISVGTGPVYAPPPVVYVRPQPVYIQPYQGYIQPHPAYGQPYPVYVQPYPVYVQPYPVYVQPRPIYVQPHTIYVQPGPVVQIGKPYYREKRHKRDRKRWGHERDRRY